jgi:hypothetical protein
MTGCPVRACRVRADAPPYCVYPCLKSQILLTSSSTGMGSWYVYRYRCAATRICWTRMLASDVRPACTCTQQRSTPPHRPELDGFPPRPCAAAASPATTVEMCESIW